MQLHGSELKKGVVIERGASPWQIFSKTIRASPCYPPFRHGAPRPAEL